jgi:hypothetical protein
VKTNLLFLFPARRTALFSPSKVLKPENSESLLDRLRSPDERFQLLKDVSNPEYAPARRTSFRISAVCPRRCTNGATVRCQQPATRRQGPSWRRYSIRPSIPGGSFSASQHGLLVISSPLYGNQLTWFDRAGRRLGTVGTSGFYQSPQISPDGQTLVVDPSEPVSFSPYVWRFPLHGTPSRFTFRPSERPLWSPDGKQIAFEP